MEQKTIEQTMLNLLKASLFTNEFIRITDWDKLFEEMKVQTIATLPADWIAKYYPSKYSAWLNYYLLQQGQWVKVMYGQDQLLKLFEQHGIPCVIIKGSASAMAYPNPKLRMMGDVDFLVKRIDFNRSAALLKENGYMPEEVINHKSHHCRFSRDGIRYELHKRLGVVRESDERLISVFEEGIDKREYVEIEEYNFPVLPVCLNGAVLAFHINQHLREGLGLRQIVDWMMYIDALSDDVWFNSVLPMMRETGLEKLMLTVTAMCQKYLGLRTIVEMHKEYPVDMLMAYILEMGNFGRKTGFEGKPASFILSTSGITDFFKRLQRGGLHNWEAVRRYKALRPFAWIYQALRIPRVLHSNGMRVQEVLKQAKHGVEQYRIIDALELDNDRTIHAV